MSFTCDPDTIRIYSQVYFYCFLTLLLINFMVDNTGVFCNDIWSGVDWSSGIYSGQQVDCFLIPLLFAPLYPCMATGLLDFIFEI